MLKNLKIRTKLLAGFGIILVLVLALGFYNIYQLKQIDRIGEFAVEQAHIQSKVAQLEADFIHLLEPPFEYILHRELIHGGVGLHERFDSAFAKVDEDIKHANEEIEKSEKLFPEFHSAEEHGEQGGAAAAAAAAAEKHLHEVEKLVDLLFAIDWADQASSAKVAEKVVEVGHGHGGESVGIDESDPVALMEAIEAEVDEVLHDEFAAYKRIASEEFTKSQQALQDVYANARIASYAFLALIFFLALSLGVLLSRAISKSISQARNAAVEIAKGNMDVEIDTSGKDEVAELSQAIDKMRVSLKVVMEEYEKKIK